MREPRQEKSEGKTDLVALSKELLDTEDVRILFNCTKQTLARWRTRGIGPPWIVVGGEIRYHRDGIKEYMRSGDRKAPKTAKQPSRRG